MINCKYDCTIICVHEFLTSFGTSYFYILIIYMYVPLPSRCGHLKIYDVLLNECFLNLFYKHSTCKDTVGHILTPEEILSACKYMHVNHFTIIVHKTQCTCI